MPRSPSDDRRLPRDLGRPDGRFHIERITDVNGEHFAVYEGEELQFYAPTLFKAEIEMKLWQKRIETDEQLAARAVEIEALRAEVETQIAKRTHTAVSSKGGSAEREKTERPWMAIALPIVEEQDLGGVDIAPALRKHWDAHPGLAREKPLPTNDAIIKWSQRIGRSQRRTRQG